MSLGETPSIDLYGSGNNICAPNSICLNVTKWFSTQNNKNGEGLSTGEGLGNKAQEGLGDVACHRRNGPATPLRVFSVSAKLAAALADASRARAKVGFERGICFLEEAHAVAEDLRIMPEFQDQVVLTFD